MPDRRSRFRFVLPVLLGLLLTAGCGGPSTLQSGSPSAPPTIDGALDEWGGSLAYLDGEPVSMSVVPTDSVLFVALTTQDQRLIQSIARNGLIVWVDPAGGTQRTYGIQYPLGLRQQQAGGTGPPEASASSGTASALDQLSLRELDVIRHESARTRIPAQFSSGVRAEATINPGALVYELAIPVNEAPATATEQRHGLQASLGGTVGVGLQIPEDDDTDVQLPERSGVPSATGRRGRTRRGRRGRQGRQRQRARANQATDLPTLDLWTRVVTNQE